MCCVLRSGTSSQCSPQRDRHPDAWLNCTAFYTSTWCSPQTDRYSDVWYSDVWPVLWFTCRCIAMVFPQRDVCPAIILSCAVYYFQLHRYGVPLLQCCVVNPGTSLWCFPETCILFWYYVRYCILYPVTSLCCSSASVPCCTSTYMAVVFLFTVLRCTSRYIAVVFLFISTVSYLQVHRYGIPVH